MTKRKIKQNQWGNWNGYKGARKVVEFGNDEVAAGHWMVTGQYDRYAAFASDDTLAAAKQAALSAA